jgi:hypothetical protein
MGLSHGLSIVRVLNLEFINLFLFFFSVNIYNVEFSFLKYLIYKTMRQLYNYLESLFKVCPYEMKQRLIVLYNIYYDDEIAKK